MYPKADFLRRFETLDGEALLDKLANSPPPCCGWRA